VTEEKIKKPRKKRKPTRKLQPFEWAAIVAQYETGRYTQKQLAEMNDIKPETVNRHFKSIGGVNRERHAQELEMKIKEEVEDRMLVEIDKTAKRFLDAQEQSFTLIDGAEKMAAVVMRRMAKNGVKATQEDKDAVKTIADLTSIITNVLTHKHFVLGARDGKLESEDNLPDLQIVKMTEQNIKDVMDSAEDDGFGESDVSALEESELEG